MQVENKGHKFSPHGRPRARGCRNGSFRLGMGSVQGAGTVAGRTTAGTL